MDVRRKLYAQGLAALVVSVVAGLLVEVCCSYTNTFEEIASTVIAQQEED